MAQVHEHASGSNPAPAHFPLDAVNWPLSTTQTAASPTSGTIEIRGSTYLAYCKSWAPAWIDPDDDDALDV